MRVIIRVVSHLEVIYRVNERLPLGVGFKESGTFRYITSIILAFTCDIVSHDNSMT